MAQAEAGKGRFRVLATEFFPVTISLFSLVLSTFNLYVGYLKAPDINFVVAPYVSHLVDANSKNEAFFIPLTVINRGARPGTVLSFDLLVTRSSDGQQEQYFAQYYGQSNNARALGDYFTPLTLNGYSSTSQTVCFYPTGFRSGTFFSQRGDYTFRLVAVVANVQAASRQSVMQVFRITMTDGMLARTEAQPNGEYPYPIPVETPKP